MVSIVIIIIDMFGIAFKRLAHDLNSITTYILKIFLENDILL